MPKKKTTTQDLGELLTVNPVDIFRITKEGIPKLGDFAITKEEVVALQEEIKFLERTRIWSILTATLADSAKKIMFEKSKSFEDMRTGKALLYNIQLMKTIMKQIRSAQITQTESQKVSQPKKV